MTSQAILVPLSFFEEMLPEFNHNETQLYLHLLYLSRWQSSKPSWTTIDYDQLWEKFGLNDYDIGLILLQLQSKKRITYSTLNGLTKVKLLL